MLTLSINQPCYLPWPFYFSRIIKSDIHVILDHVQYEKNSFTNRNYIISNNKPLLLTLPIKHKGRFKNNPISDLELTNYEKIFKKH